MRYELVRRKQHMRDDVFLRSAMCVHILYIISYERATAMIICDLVFWRLLFDFRTAGKISSRPYNNNNLKTRAVRSYGLTIPADDRISTSRTNCIQSTCINCCVMYIIDDCYIIMTGLGARGLSLEGFPLWTYSTLCI